MSVRCYRYRHLAVTSKPAADYATRPPSAARTSVTSTRLHQSSRQPPDLAPSIEIPHVFEDRCALQLVICQVLRALVNKSIDSRCASTLLYGLQLASQNVDRESWAVPISVVRSITHTRDGDELAAPAYEYDIEGEENEEEGDKEEGEEGELADGEQEDEKEGQEEEEQEEGDEEEDGEQDVENETLSPGDRELMQKVLRVFGH